MIKTILLQKAQYDNQLFTNVLTAQNHNLIREFVQFNGGFQIIIEKEDLTENLEICLLLGIPEDSLLIL